MKKFFVIISSLLGLFFTAQAQDRADRQQLSDPNSFSMILLGDPQGYIKYDINQPLFDLCTAWIADNIDNLHIKAVLCTGDLVEQNENIVRNRKMLNQTSREMWEAVSNSFKRLDDKVPYIISTGNHEYGYQRAENGMTHFPEYFPFERNDAWRDICVSAEVLDWAKKLIAEPKYKEHKVIFMTHSFLRERTAERTDNESYTITPRNWGKAVWEKLVKPSSNIFLVICGHTGKPGDFEDSVAYRVDKNDSGKEVHQMMFNVQVLGGGWEGNGGDGWLRILEFLPDGKTIKVKTYSPLFGISPSTKHLAHRTGSCDQFDIVIE